MAISIRNEQLMHDKAQLNATLNTLGWRVVMRLAEESVKTAEEEAWNCKDKTQREDLFLKGQAAREFLKNFNERITQMRNVELVEEHFLESSF